MTLETVLVLVSISFLQYFSKFSYRYCIVWFCLINKIICISRNLNVLFLNAQNREKIPIMYLSKAVLFFRFPKWRNPLQMQYCIFFTYFFMYRCNPGFFQLWGIDSPCKCLFKTTVGIPDGWNDKLRKLFFRKRDCTFIVQTWH